MVYKVLCISKFDFQRPLYKGLGLILYQTITQESLPKKMSSNDIFFSDFKQQYNICPSHCCLCGRTLTDPSSIEFGIGPVCRKKWNYDDAPLVVDVNVSDLKDAIAAGFPETAADYLISKLVSSTGMSRELAKCVVYYTSSLGVSNGDELMHCLHVLTLLGYARLANHLFEKSTGHQVWPDEETDQKFYYKGPFDKQVNSHIKAHYKGLWDRIGRQWVLTGNYQNLIVELIKHRTGVSFPSTQKVESKESSNEKVIEMQKIGQTLSLCPPYTNDFRIKVKAQFSARWNAQYKKWEVNSKHNDQLLGLITSIYPDYTVNIIDK